MFRFRFGSFWTIVLATVLILTTVFFVITWIANTNKNDSSVI
ncbi:MAG: hypothetical protein ACPL3A_01915 [Thermoanaerobacteraceae bacterium]